VSNVLKIKKVLKKPWIKYLTLVLIWCNHKYSKMSKENSLLKVHKENSFLIKLMIMETITLRNKMVKNNMSIKQNLNQLSKITFC
jgi:hypothetical protein